MSGSAILKSFPGNWLVPVFAATTFATNFSIPMAGMPVLFKQISEDLNLSVVQIGSVWGILSLGSILVMPMGGILCDRIGNKRAIIIIGLLSGVLGALRGASNSFVSLMATAFLWGLVCAAIIPAINIISSAYVPKNKQGLAQGLIACGGAGGLALGSFISAPWLSTLVGGWRNVFFLYGGIAVLVSFVWWFGVKEPVRDPCGKVERVSSGSSLAYLLHLKPLWIVGLSMMAFQGCVQGMQGYLPYFLQDKGWTAAAASGALAVYNVAGALSVIPITLVSDKIGSRKIPLTASFMVTITGVALLSVVHNGLLWALVIVAGALFPMASALFTTICIEIKEVGTTYAGTAVGLMLGIAFIGRAFAPPVGNSLAGVSSEFAWPFIFWSGLAVAGLALLGLLKETGHQGGERKP